MLSKKIQQKNKNKIIEVKYLNLIYITDFSEEIYWK